MGGTSGEYQLLLGSGQEGGLMCVCVSQGLGLSVLAGGEDHIL